MAGTGGKDEREARAIPSAAAVEEARALLRQHLRPTRLVRAESLERATGAEVYLKLESELPTGSFKLRGALHALLMTARQRAVIRVVAASTGNHGAAVAFAARLADVPATIFLPEGASPVKRDRIDRLGASIVERGLKDLTAAIEAAELLAQDGGHYLLSDAGDPLVPAATATIACELLDELPRPDAILIPMGDTSLIRGVAAEAKRRHAGLHILGVQAEEAPAYVLSWREGRAVATESCATIADGLAVRRPLEANVHAIRALVDETRLVSEQEMLDAIRALLLDEHLVAEPAGAAATAALLQDRAAYRGRRVVVLVTGANLSLDLLRHAIGQRS